MASPQPLTLAIFLSFLGPLDALGGLLHMLGPGSDNIYNFWAKSTWFPPVPYAISFGALPGADHSAAEMHPPNWASVDLILVSLSVHFLNVIKDLEWDLNQSVLGFLQRIGRVKSILAAASCLGAALLIPIL